MGNPYLGVQAGNRSGTANLEAGVRLPVVAESGRYPYDPFASDVAMRTDFDRFEAFLEDHLAVSLHGSIQPPEESGMFLRIRLGTLYLREIGAGDGRADGFRLDAGSMLGFRTRLVELRAMYSLRMPFTDPGFPITREIVDQVTFGAFAVRPGLRPGAFIRFPIASAISDRLDSTMGFSLAFDVR
jgi:hypothetical protein